MAWWRWESAVERLLREEVEWLRAQLEMARQNQERLRHEVITLASSRAAAEIQYYAAPTTGSAAQPPTTAWPPKRGPISASPFDNHLSGGEHIEFVPEDPEPRPGQPLDEEELVDRTIEVATRQREAERLHMIPTVAD